MKAATRNRLINIGASLCLLFAVGVAISVAYDKGVIDTNLEVVDILKDYECKLRKPAEPK